MCLYGCHSNGPTFKKSRLCNQVVQKQTSGNREPNQCPMKKTMRELFPLRHQETRNLQSSAILFRIPFEFIKIERRITHSSMILERIFFPLSKTTFCIFQRIFKEKVTVRVKKQVFNYTKKKDLFFDKFLKHFCCPLFPGLGG